jgi:hypothetical protein
MTADSQSILSTLSELEPDSCPITTAALEVVSARHTALRRSTPVPAQPLETIGRLITEELEKQQALVRHISGRTTELLELSIRLSWLLEDACSLLEHAQWLPWLRRTIGISRQYCNQLRRLGRCFQRDLIDAERCRQLGLTGQGHSEPAGPPLAVQIDAFGVASIKQLFRLARILPPLPPPGGRSFKAKPNASEALTQIGKSLTYLRARLEAVDLQALSCQEREARAGQLRGLVQYFQRLTSLTP